MSLLKKAMLAVVTFVLALVAFVAPVRHTNVEAASIPAGTVLYLTPNANWKQSKARFAAYFFGNGEAWVSMTKVAGETDVYQVTSPSKSFTNVIFCRMNPNASANNWNNKWNQTSDLIFDGTKNHYLVKENTWDKGAGTWTVFGSGDIVVPEPEPEPEPDEYNLGVIGSFCGWGTDVDMTFNAEKERYELVREFKAGDQWKIRQDDDWGFSWGWHDENNHASIKTYCEEGKEPSGSKNGNICFKETGEYLIWIDLNRSIGVEKVVQPWKLEVKVGFQVGTKDEAKALRLVAELNLDAEMLETFESTIAFRVTHNDVADERVVTTLYSSVNPMNDEAVREGAYYAVLTYTNIPAGEYTVEVLVDGVVAATVTATVA